MSRRLRANGPLTAGLVLSGALVAMAIAGCFVEAAPAQDLSQALLPPSRRHPLGADPFGVDLLTRILAGARHSLVVAAAVTATNLALGLVIGTFAAIGPRLLAAFATRAIDCFLAFPGLLLAILLASILPRSEATVFFALTVTGWTSRARFCRALALQIWREPFIEAARASGAGPLRLVRAHVWPSMLGQLVVQAALSLGHVLIGEASLSFLGLGGPPGASGNSSWGGLIAEGREYLVEAPHLSVFPGLAFVLGVLAFNLLAEGLRRRLAASQAGF